MIDCLSLPLDGEEELALRRHVIGSPPDPSAVRAVLRALASRELGFRTASTDGTLGHNLLFLYPTIYVLDE